LASSLIDITAVADLDLQSASHDIWDQKYRLKTRDGEALEQTPHDTLERVADALAEVEREEVRAYWAQQFRWALHNGAIPAGRILSNAGAQDYRPSTSTINCTVSGTINDSMDDILGKLHEAGLTLKGGSGIGYEFSTLRPKGAYVSGADAYTSGPLSFMDIFDSMCKTISSAGGRRGAQMATFDVGHPDVMEFIQAKQEDGRFRQFNLSLLITSSFIDAVKADAQWPLAFPLTDAEISSDGIDVDDDSQVLWRTWPIVEGYRTNAGGAVACRIYETIPAVKLWDAIMTSTYDYAEPGFILIDRVNEMNNNWFDENIRTTNPCGEQPLPPYGACLLGSINLTKFVERPFTTKVSFDWERFRKVVRIFVRMLDNVVEIHGLRLEPQALEILRKRRHGMGFLGLGSTLTMMKMRYGDAESLHFTEAVSYELALVGWQEALELAREKGPAPIMNETFRVSEEMLLVRPEMATEGYTVGDKIPGRVLHARYSRYMQQLSQDNPELIEALAQTGARFTHHSSVAPTGTIALSIANNASNGIEPSFAHHYVRNVIRPDKKAKEQLDVYSYELLAYRAYVNGDATFGDTSTVELPDYFVASADITPKQHVDVQAAAQKWIDSSISKTANVASDYPFEQFKDIYLYACEKQLKGCTTFRFNPERFQGVMVTTDDLKDTTYRFTLASGQVVDVRGDEMVEYEGETHSAANLYDALKEGYYGKL
jgi:ribonucleoside-diphosphate reductase alpha chain